MSTIKGLTGGTKDVNPQYISGSVNQTVADAFTVVEVPLPINRLGGSFIIIELLKFTVVFGVFPACASATEIIELMEASLSTGSAIGQHQMASPRSLARLFKRRLCAFTAGGTFSDQYAEPGTWDFTDGAGHGVLVATDSIFVSIDTANTLILNGISFKILYRFKKVTIQEYVGIVQSQQGG